MSYLATGLHLLLRLLWLRLLGNHGRCHILACVLRAHRLLIGEPQRQRALREQWVVSQRPCDSAADWPDCWWTTFAVMSSPQRRQTGDPVYSGHPESSSETLRIQKEQTCSTELLCLYWPVVLTYMWGQTPRCERICASCGMTPKASGCGWSGREPPSGWRCWAGTRNLNPGIAVMVRGHVSSNRTQIPPSILERSHLLCRHLRLGFFYTELSALLCSHLCIAVGWKLGMSYRPTSHGGLLWPLCFRGVI